MAFSTPCLINASLRVFFFMFIVISLGLEAHLRARQYNVARVNLGIAASVIGIVLSGFAAIPLLVLENTLNMGILFAFDFITFGLTLAASASLTNQRRDCHEIAKGHTAPRGKCSEFRTGIAFLYMDWIMLLFLLILEIYQMATGSSSNSDFGSGYASRYGGSHYKSSTRSGGLGFGSNNNNNTAATPVVDENLAKTEDGYADKTATA